MSNCSGIKKLIDDADMEYVLACRKGDSAAFEILVERHQKKMLNLAYRITGNYDEACDVTQEAFIAAYKAIKKFKGEAKFSTWLCRIVINYAKNHLKRMAKAARREVAVVDGPGKMKREKGFCLHFPNAANPGELLEQHEREAYVQKCIASLPEEYREVLVLRDIQGFSYEDICDVLKIAEGTVKSRLSRARGALKDCLIKVIGEL